MDIMKRISKAKTSLILESPFFGRVACELPVILDETIPTACTNGKEIRYNPKFVDELDDEELKFLVAHECAHPMLEHNFRRGERNPRTWNKAADYVINKLLVDEKIGRMPKMGLLSDDIYNAGHGTSEGIYNILPHDPEGKGGFGGEGDPLDDCQDAQGTPAEKSQQEAEWKVKVAQAAQAAKMMGKMTASLERLVTGILQPKVNWRDVLHKFVEKCKDDQRSYARPNRRFISQGLYMPSVTGERLGEIAIAVDCSGSITNELINQFASEIRTIHEDGRPSLIHVMYFDHAISHYEKYGREDTLDIKPHGGGGTRFSPVFKYMQEHDINPVACIFLTDLQCDDFGDAPEYPVLWVSTDKGEAPFGEVVVM